MTKILVIEDEAPLRAEITDILLFEGYDVLEAGDGRAGLELALAHSPTLIVCDISMPELDGYGVLDHLRRHPEHARTPFIFLTARADRSFMRHGMELGADDYLTKPFSRAELLSAVHARLERSSAINASFVSDLEDAKAQITRLVMEEMQAPLVPMRLVTDIIQRQIDNLTPAMLQDLIAGMSAGVDQLSRVVDQMVYLTHLETGILKQEVIQESGKPISLNQTLRRAAELGGTLTQRTDLPVRVRTSAREVQVVAHAQALTRALAELIAEVIDSSMPSTEVIVTLNVKRDQAVISILQERSFQGSQGTSLGTLVAHGIIEAHGGKVEYQAISETGTDVIVSLPMPVAQPVK